MRLIVRLAQFLCVLVIASLVGCKDNSTNPPAPKLAIVSQDTITWAVAGNTVQLRFLVTADGKPTAGAHLNVKDALWNQIRDLGPSDTSGVILFSELIPSTIQPGTYPLRVVATETGATPSDTLIRHLTVEQQSLAIQVDGLDTLAVNLGNTYGFTLHVNSGGMPVDGAAVTVRDPEAGATASGITAKGDYTYLSTAARAGIFAITFQVSKQGFKMDSVTRYLVVNPSSQPLTNMNLGVNAPSATSLGALWNRDPIDNGVDTVYVTSTTSTKKVLVPPPGSRAVIDGLSEHIVYKVSVHSALGISETVQWETADRLGPIRLYETADNVTGENAGLVLKNGTALSVRNQANSALVDLVLASDPSSSSGLSLVAGAVTSLSGFNQGRLTYVSDSYTVPGIDSLFYSSDLSTMFSGNYTAVDLPATGSDPYVFAVYTNDRHYAKMEIVQQSNGKLYGTSAKGFYYIDVLISYQPDANAPYASRPKPLQSNVEKRTTPARHWTRQTSARVGQ